jgi:hypothetical protein
MTVVLCHVVPRSLRVSRSCDVVPGKVEAWREGGFSKGLEATQREVVPAEQSNLLFYTSYDTSCFLAA